MRVSQLHLQNFTKHADTTLKLPDRGIVAVTGNNGSGKSSVIEGVAVGGWGDTLRGASAWREGKDGAVQVTAANVSITRARTAGGKTTLTWAASGEPVAYETTTKAQEALEAIIGTFNVWRRTCVFSSQDAAHFTSSTDGERKRLLESILNLSRFDDALERCKVARKAADDSHQRLNTGLVSLKAKLESERLRVRDAGSVVAGLPPAVDVGDARAKLGKLTKALNDVAAEISALNVAQRNDDRKVATLEAQARESARRLSALDIGNCDKCGQGIPQSLVAELRGAVDRDTAAVREARAAAETVRLDRAELLNELSDERDAFQRQQFELQAKLTDASTNAHRRQQAEQMLASAQASVSELEGRINKGETLVTQAASELAVLQAVELVLGMKGVRAHVLGKTLSGLEAVANSWLSRIAGPGLRLTMRPYSEKKSGGVSDAISLEVHGAGGGHGYRAASGGERRRIDVALLLALAEVAQAAHGKGDGSTLFFDECMDSLDRDGIVAVTTALRDLSRERCVVVVTHDRDLLEELRPDTHYVVDAGQLKEAT